MNEYEMLDVLFEQGFISADQRKIAHLEQRHSGLSIQEILLENNFVEDEAIARLTSVESGLEFAEFDSLIPDSQAVGMIPVEVARSHLAVPLGFDESDMELRVAVTDIDDVPNLDSLRAAIDSKANIRFFITPLAQIHQALDRLYGFELSIDGLLFEMEGTDFQPVVESEYSDHKSHPVVRLVEAILADALKNGASDIHFEPESSFLRIRYRIDGVLQVVRSIHRSFWPPLAARIKLLSKLDIAETRAAQDGSFSINFSASQVDLRTSTFPTIYGESIVVRLHAGRTSVLSLRQLGMCDELVSLVRETLSIPHGIVIVAGPTGSGKTTTLYALLREVSSEAVNSMSLEDPVEQRLPLVRQCEVSARIKLTFTDGVRSILRQDPDVILLGEIRDSLTAELAFRAALTGHLVFATVHANSGVGVYQRLIDLGVNRNLAAQLINLVISQRLIRLLCSACKAAAAPSTVEHTGNTTASTTQPDGDDSRTVQKHRVASCNQPTGCEQCGWRGYAGRTALTEMLVRTSKLEELIECSASHREFSAYLESVGHQNNQAVALDLVARGLTSLEEVTRVTGPVPTTVE